MTIKCPYCGEKMVLDEVCDDTDYYECPACGYIYKKKGREH